MNKQIEYKSTYNESRGLSEPKWGPLMSEISPDYPTQCPTCGSHNMYASAHPNDPEEIFPHETVRCGDCGHITDWYEALSAYEHHYTDTPLPVARTPRVLNRRVDMIPPDALYVGRPSKWGNQFKIGIDGTREEVVELFRAEMDDRLKSVPSLITNLKEELQGKDLVCWCAPLSCHADILLELANKKEVMHEHA
ncbi:unnamed protein product [marine sediment metagenome]|uniref:DUF4326 domain-containing protein n=1 Tax=marine sediment metagenome TaxID=412755 RepID=X1LLG0_9ZZZZ